MNTVKDPRPLWQQRQLRQIRPLFAGLGLALVALQAQADVGLTRLMAGDLPVTLVYPTDARASVTVQGPFELNVAVDAAPRAGRHRLVVMSHGTGGSASADHDMAATLARAGFVVAQPLHAGDNFQDASQAGPVAWARRPQEVSRVIDLLAQHPAWGPRLQLDRVGVHGMSAGGVTALSLAGAQWSILQLVRHCVEHADDDLGFCFNGLATPDAQATRRASFERARGVPDAFLPAALKLVQGGRSPAESADPRPDPRVAAVSVAVPVAAIFSAESLARIQVPVAVVRAGRDQMLQPAFHTDHLLRNCTRCSLVATLEGAGHTDLLSPWPASVARSMAAKEARGGAPEPGFDPRERQAAFRALAAFFQQQLNGD
jgi:predicted dienelactone hydrolase